MDVETVLRIAQVVLSVAVAVCALMALKAARDVAKALKGRD